MPELDLGRFDVMQWIGDDSLWGKLAPGAIAADVDGLSIQIVSYKDLVALKEAAGRPEDLADLQRLRQPEANWSSRPDRGFFVRPPTCSCSTRR